MSLMKTFGLFSCLQPIFAGTVQPEPCRFQWGSFKGEMVLPGCGRVQQAVDKGGGFRLLGV